MYNRFLPIYLIKLEKSTWWSWKKNRKKWECYFGPILTVGNWTVSSASNFGDELVYHLCCLVLNFSLVYNRNWRLSNVVSKNNLFFVPKFAPNLLILQLAGLNSIEYEIGIRKFLFFDRLLTEPKMTFVVKSLFQSRPTSYIHQQLVAMLRWHMSFVYMLKIICIWNVYIIWKYTHMP